MSNAVKEMAFEMETAIVDFVVIIITKHESCCGCHAPKVCSNFILDYYITFVAAACSVLFTGRDFCQTFCR